MTHYKDLFKAIKIGSLQLPHRIIMAPLTRCRADRHHNPTDLMAEYYSQRSSAGFIIAEATMVMPKCSAFGGTDPGIYSHEQIAGWKKITNAVHAKGGKILLQLWHGGRACHPLLNDGQECVSASAIAIEGETHTPQGKVAYTVPRALELNEIQKIIEGFKTAAKNAKDAGFDGVEVHGANGYLLDQFLRDSCNKRTDSYGGHISNRAKLLLEVTKAVISVWGADKVGVRVSPLNSYNSMKDSNPLELTVHVSRELSSLKIAYLHMMRSDFFGLQSGDVMTAARENFKGVLIGNMGYSAEEANMAIQKGLIDAVAFGHHYVSNPDLVERIKLGGPIVEPNQNTLYSQGEIGYIDYPFMSK